MYTCVSLFIVLQFQSLALDEAYCASVRARIDDNCTQELSHYGVATDSRLTSGTCQVSILMGNGDAVSFTTTVNSPWVGPSVSNLTNQFMTHQDWPRVTSKLLKIVYCYWVGQPIKIQKFLYNITIGNWDIDNNNNNIIQLIIDGCVWPIRLLWANIFTGFGWERTIGSYLKILTIE